MILTIRHQNLRNRNRSFLLLLLLVSTLIVLSACERTGVQKQSLQPGSFALLEENQGNRKVMLKTDDGVVLRAIEYLPLTTSASQRSKNVILLHMLDGQKEDWESLAQFLQKKNLRVFSIDLRGHGQSEGDWQSYSDADFRAMMKDVVVARTYLKNASGTDRVSMVGASIGANLIAEYVDELGSTSIDKIALISPGENYHGLEVAELSFFRGDVLLVASTEDGYAVNATTELKKELGNYGQSIMYSGTAHGTEILTSHPEFKDDLASFLLK